MKKQNTYHDYNRYLKPYARKLRNQSTKAEVKIWKSLLRAKKMKGYPFLRQRPILKYIADFYCKPLRLIIEIDGSIHEVEEIKNKDIIRQRELEKAGYHVIRFSNLEVYNEIDNVKQKIEEWIVNFENENPIN